MVEKGTSSVSFFSNSDPTSNRDASTIWSRSDKIKLLDVQDIEEELLKNPKFVYFAPVLMTVLRFKSIPCKLVCTSPSIMKVCSLTQFLLQTKNSGFTFLVCVVFSRVIQIPVKQK